MSLSTLVRSTIINGTNTIAVAIRNGIVYRLQPIETMKEIVFHNFEANKPRIFNLSEELTEDYQIVGVTVDFPDDDNEELPEGDQRPLNYIAGAYVRIVSKNKAVENLALNLTSYPTYINKLYINHNDVWKIKINRAVNKITFRCVPVIIDKRVNFN